MNKILDKPQISDLCEQIKKAAAEACAMPHDTRLHGFKWINLVLQGGGTLGICHVGVIHGLELAGYRFAGVAGTSAGAIAALLVASGRECWTHACGVQLLEILASMPSQEFIDGPYLVRRLIKDILVGGNISFVESAIPVKAAASQLLRFRGMNPGLRLEEWLQDVLESRFQISSLAQLDNRIRQGACDEFVVPLQLDSVRRSRLKMVATGLPYGHKFVFPDDADVLDWERETISPAIYARASMSIPFFFAPLVVPVQKHHWAEQYKTRFVRGLPDAMVKRVRDTESIEFVDGGILSNFPIDIFFDDEMNGKPITTFGLSMYSSETQNDSSGRKSEVIELGMLAARIFQAARLRRDRDAVQNLPESSRLAMVDTGPHNWLNFSLDEDATTDLFRRGLEAVLSLIPQRAMA